MYEKYNDHELVYLYHQGNEEALNLLLKKYNRILLSLAKRHYRNVKTSCEISDLYQIGLIAFYNGLYTYKENQGCKFGTYVKTVVDRSILNYIRHAYSHVSRANREAISMDQSVHEKEGIYIVDTIESAVDEYDPVKFIHAKDMMEKIEVFVQTQNKDVQTVYYLWAQGYSYVEIHKILNLSIKRVGNILYYLKRRIREMLET